MLCRTLHTLGYCRLDPHSLLSRDTRCQGDPRARLRLSEVKRVHELGAHDWINALCATTQLAFAVLAFTRNERSDVALPLGLLFLSIFGWNLATLASHLTGHAAWHHLDNVLAPLTIGFSLHFVINFTGARRPGRPFVVVTYAAAGLLSLTAGTAFFSDWGLRFSYSLTFVGVFICLIGAVALAVFVLLVRHLLRCAPGLERLRTRLIIAAAVIQTALGTIELWMPLWCETPPLAIQGSFLSSALLYVTAFRLRLLERPPSLFSTAWTLVLALVFVVAYVAIIQPLSTLRGVLFVGGLMLAIGLAAVTIRAWTEAQRSRGKLERLAFLGRFNDQLVHDIRNPLAALKGASDFLKVERERGHSLDEQDEFLDVIAEQTGRLAQLIEKHRRFGRLELTPELVDLNAVVNTTLDASTARFDNGLRIVRELTEERPTLRVDRELLVVVLDNVLRNAIEAMPDGGTIEVRTRGEPDGVSIAVCDEGRGMDARVLARCTDELFTTKPLGNGLGLCFARRVVEAHEGHLEISSSAGRGTEVRLHLPRN